MEKQVMKDTEIVRDIMKETGTTQMMLKDMLGYKAQSSVSGRLNTPRMSVERFSAMLDVLGYEVVVRDKAQQSDKEWIVLADRKNA